MTSLVRILSVQTIDSSPSLLLVSPNGRKTLVNCGEGCQRIFLEFAQKISSVDRVCLSSLKPDAMAGLPGMILTAADVVVVQHAAATAAAETKKQKMEGTKASTNDAPTAPSEQQPTQQKKSATSAQKDDGKTDDENNPLPGLQLIGPTGTKAFVRSLRHFMRRESFFMDIQEGLYKQQPPPKANGGQKKRKKGATKKQQQQQQDQDAWSIQSIVAYLDDVPENCNGDATATHPQSTAATTNDNPPSDSNQPQRRQVLSFLFTTPPVLGRFLADKAKELGIPKGPLYGKLKNGQTVTFPDPNDDSKTITVESHQVVEPSSPGVVVAVFYYPTVHVLQQLQQSVQLRSYQQEQQQSSKNDTIMELMVHMAPRDMFHSDNAKAWRASFGSNVRHLFMPTEATCIEEHPSDSIDENTRLSQSLTPFHSASMGTWMRSQISSNVYCQPSLSSPKSKPSIDAKNDYVDAVPLLEYGVIPRAKRGFQNEMAYVQLWKQKQEKAQSILTKSACLEAAQKLQLNGGDKKSTNEAEILFTGTGSAIPCKHRNVTGIHVRMENGNAMLLDCGEGTIGQLLRASRQTNDDATGDRIPSASSILRNIKAVWISHPHADHHLGILRLLEEKKKQRSVHGCDPLILIAPPSLNRFLMEYEQVDPDIAGSYDFFDCRALIRPGANNNGKSRNGFDPAPNKELLQRLERDVGVSSCEAITVAHCRDSFAVVFHGTSFRSLAYSGDCRPSIKFAEWARGADVLIHEATFADGLEAEAVLKKHCTVGEAIDVAKKMNAKTVILTHFSQRYPKIPTLPTNVAGMTIIPAFDFQRVSLSTMTEASLLTPVLRMLYPDTADDNDEGDDFDEANVPAAAMNIPGLFAQNQLL